MEYYRDKENNKNTQNNFNRRHMIKYQESTLVSMAKKGMPHKYSLRYALESINQYSPIKFVLHYGTILLSLVFAVILGKLTPTCYSLMTLIRMKLKMGSILS